MSQDLLEYMRSHLTMEIKIHQFKIGTNKRNPKKLRELSKKVNILQGFLAELNNN